MLDRARATSNIEFLTPYVVEALLPGETSALERARLRNVESGEEREIAATGVFVAIGHEPKSELVRGMVDLDANGYVLVDGRSTRTNRPGVFAAGDLGRPHLSPGRNRGRNGLPAALDAEWYLRDTPAVTATQQKQAA